MKLITKIINDRSYMRMLVTITTVISLVLLTMSVFTIRSEKRNRLIDKHIQSIHKEDILSALDNIKFKNDEGSICFKADKVIFEHPGYIKEMKVTSYRFYIKDKKMQVTLIMDDSNKRRVTYKFDISDGPFNIKLYPEFRKDDVYKETIINPNYIYFNDGLYELLDTRYESIINNNSNNE